MASPPDNPLKRLIGEIHRRSLWQVLGIYLIASWAVLGGVDTLGGALGLPDWFMPVALALLVVGLPFVLATAFVQEGGPGREAKDVATSTADPPTGTSGLFTWRKTFVGGVLAFALLGFVGTGWILFGGGIGGASDAGDSPNIEQSVAVLPFDNMSGDPDNEYFSDGITEELLNALAQLPGIRVPARTSSFSFKGQNTAVREIAQALGVAHVLEGSVRRDETRVLITAQLSDAQTDTQLWSETFERELEDIFAIQREIASAIVAQLQITLSGEQEARLVAGGTESPEAYEAYLRGRYFWNQRTDEAIRSAITEFQRAIELDPNYAEAHSGLADCYLVWDGYGWTREDGDFRVILEQGVNLAERAVSLSPDLGMAHSSLAYGLYMIGEWESPEEEFARAIELNPGYATAHQWYASYLFATGRPIEGMPHTERAVGLDPVSPVISRRLGRDLRMVGRNEEAVEAFRETTALAPMWSSAWLTLGSALLASGEYDEGWEAWVTYARLANADVRAVREAHQAVIRYRETGEPQTLSEPPSTLQILALSGQADRLLERFEFRVRQGAYGRAAMNHVEWMRAVLGDDPRYQALLQEAGITW